MQAKNKLNETFTKSVIIAGADGFVGYETVKKFSEMGYSVVAIVNSANTHHDFNLNNVKVIQYVDNLHNLLDEIPATIDNHREYDYFINFAWKGIYGLNRYSMEMQRHNISTTEFFLFIASYCKCKKFIVAGSLNEIDFSESNCNINNYKSCNLYAYTKLLAKNICKSISGNVNVPVSWVQITNAYGVGEISDRLINSTLRKIKNGEKVLEFSDALSYYSFVYVTDVANAFYLIATKGKYNKDYMICGKEVDILRNYLTEMVYTVSNDVVCSFGALESSMNNLNKKDFDMKQLYKDTGYVAQVSFEDGIRMTYNSLKEECKNE